MAVAEYAPSPPEIVNVAGTQLPPLQPAPVPKARPLTAGGKPAGGVNVSAPFTVSVFETTAVVAEGVEALPTSEAATPNVEGPVAVGVPLQTTAVLPALGAQVIPTGGVPVIAGKLYVPKPPDGVYVGATQAPPAPVQPVPVP